MKKYTSPGLLRGDLSKIFTYFCIDTRHVPEDLLKVRHCPIGGRCRCLSTAQFFGQLEEAMTLTQGTQEDS